MNALLPRALRTALVYALVAGSVVFVASAASRLIHGCVRNPVALAAAR
jgi:hypothetical protein